MRPRLEQKGRRRNRRDSRRDFLHVCVCVGGCVGALEPSSWRLSVATRPSSWRPSDERCAHHRRPVASDGVQRAVVRGAAHMEVRCRSRSATRRCTQRRPAFGLAVASGAPRFKCKEERLKAGSLRPRSSCCFAGNAIFLVSFVFGFSFPLTTKRYSTTNESSRLAVSACRLACACAHACARVPGRQSPVLLSSIDTPPQVKCRCALARSGYAQYPAHRGHAFFWLGVRRMQSEISRPGVLWVIKVK